MPLKIQPIKIRSIFNKLWLLKLFQRLEEECNMFGLDYQMPSNGMINKLHSFNQILNLINRSSNNNLYNNQQEVQWEWQRGCRDWIVKKTRELPAIRFREIYSSVAITEPYMSDKIDFTIIMFWSWSEYNCSTSPL